MLLEGVGGANVTWPYLKLHSYRNAAVSGVTAEDFKACVRFLSPPHSDQFPVAMYRYSRILKVTAQICPEFEALPAQALHISLQDTSATTSVAQEVNCFDSEPVAIHSRFNKLHSHVQTSQDVSGTDICMHSNHRNKKHPVPTESKLPPSCSLPAKMADNKMAAAVVQHAAAVFIVQHPVTSLCHRTVPDLLKEKGKLTAISCQ